VEPREKPARGYGEKRGWNSNIKWFWKLGCKLTKSSLGELKPQQVLILLTIRETGKLKYQILKKMQNLFMRKTINKLEI
jgi:hypothetical protein